MPTGLTSTLRTSRAASPRPLATPIARSQPLRWLEGSSPMGKLTDDQINQGPKAGCSSPMAVTDRTNSSLQISAWRVSRSQGLRRPALSKDCARGMEVAGDTRDPQRRLLLADPPSVLWAGRSGGRRPKPLSWRPRRQLRAPGAALRTFVLSVVQGGALNRQRRPLTITGLPPPAAPGRAGTTEVWPSHLSRNSL